MRKVAVILQAGPGIHESFDGAATEWLATWTTGTGGLFNVLKGMGGGNA